MMRKVSSQMHSWCWILLYAWKGMEVNVCEEPKKSLRVKRQNPVFCAHLVNCCVKWQWLSDCLFGKITRIVGHCSLLFLYRKVGFIWSIQPYDQIPKSSPWPKHNLKFNKIFHCPRLVCAYFTNFWPFWRVTAEEILGWNLLRDLWTRFDLLV